MICILVVCVWQAAFFIDTGNMITGINALWITFVVCNMMDSNNQVHYIMELFGMECGTLKTVLLINGSPHKEGCTFTALTEVAKELRKYGVDTNIFQIGTKPIRGCIACEKCRELSKCVFDDDIANRLLSEIGQADGVVIGSPVYFGGPNGALCAALDRVFYAGMDSDPFSGKPGAAVVSCRRGGASATFDRLNKYFTMPVISSQYWNSVHGFTPDDVRKDLEGLQTMRTLGANMAWGLNSIEKAAIEPPEKEPRVLTNFID